MVRVLHGREIARELHEAVAVPAVFLGRDGIGRADLSATGIVVDSVSRAQQYVAAGIERRAAPSPNAAPDPGLRRSVPHRIERILEGHRWNANRREAATPRGDVARGAGTDIRKTVRSERDRRM